MNLIIKFPTRERPDKFFDTLELYRDYLSNKHRVDFIVSCDSDDATMNNPSIINRFNSYHNVSVKYGNSKGKVEAINADLDEINFDILLLASDDMRPKVRGYDDVICGHMNQYYPDLDGVLHYNDGRAYKTLNTLCILGRKYYDRFGYIYHPDYTSLWCDNEFQLVSEGLGKATYIDQVIIHHAWTSYVGRDDLMEHNESYKFHDKAIFEKRQAAGFPVQSVL